MAEDEEPSRPSFLVMGDILHDIRLVDNRQDWVKVNCLRREAYGCGKNGDRIVDGLTLYVRAGRQDLHPSLCIGATRGVLKCVGSEIEEEMAETYGRDIRLSGSVYTVAGDVIVLRVSFLARHDSSDFQTYYLVYDSTAAALFLLPHELPDCVPICTKSPLALKIGEDNYSLVLMAVENRSTAESPHPFFLTWSPPAVLPYPTSKRKFKLDKCGWMVKSRIRQDARFFTASVLFLYKGSAVWGDLGLGIMWVDCSDLNERFGLVGKFNYLPSHCRTRGHFDEAPLALYRNMGCVGDSIWFVIIEPSKEEECPGETMVCVWTLDLVSNEGQWEPLHEFKMHTIWELDGFRDQGLPETVPKYPILRQQDDGILYMLLPEPSRGGRSYAHLVGIDLSSSCDVMRLVVNIRLSIPWMDRPVVLDHDFFSPRHMPV